MSDYRQAVKSLTKEQRIVVAHLEELIGDMKAVRVATLFRGQEAIIAQRIEQEIMAHLMPDFRVEIGKERSKIELVIHEMNNTIVSFNRTRAELQKLIDDFESKLSILGHIQALSKEGKVSVILPESEK